jgi:hypothetical protein
MAYINELVQPQSIEDEIAELKRKLKEAELRLSSVTEASSRAVPDEPTVMNNGRAFLPTSL